MLSSIHPLGERGRHNRWALTVTAFTLGAVASGAAVGAVAGHLGGLVFTGLSGGARLGLIGLAAAVAGGADLAGIAPPGPSRQVNEHWIGHYRGWVYGGAFGAQLGAGVVTYVVTWGVYAVVAAEVLAGSAATGAVVGVVFGLGRSASVLAAGVVRRPSDLTSFHRAIARLGPGVARIGSATLGAAGLAAVVGGLL